MRKKIVAGNWKMNKSAHDTNLFIKQLNNIKQDISNQIETIIFPPYIYINLFKDKIDSQFRFGAQNVASSQNGAYTGEVSASMLQELCCSYCIVGHSERRNYFHETENELAKKVNLLLEHDITPIYCCGEVLSDREHGKHFDIIKQQIEQGILHLSSSEIKKIVIAYEPVWAIGTGKTASPNEAQEVHSFIRKILQNHYGVDISNQISILYGGSCNPKNAKELFACKDIDGGLIGGASLQVDTFTKIINSF